MNSDECLPIDRPCEDQVLGCLLIARSRLAIFERLSEDHFYLGRWAFAGWLFRQLHYAPLQTRKMLKSLLTARNRREASKRGVDNLEFTLGELAVDAERRRLEKCLQRLEMVHEMRERIIKASADERAAWMTWHKYHEHRLRLLGY